MVKEIKIGGLEPNSTYRVTFRYVAQIQYSVYDEHGHVAAGWFNTKFFRHDGAEIGGHAQVSGTFSLTGSTGESDFLTFNVELWAEADGGDLYGYDIAVIDVVASIEVYSIEKTEDGDDGGGGGGGGGDNAKYSELNVRSKDEYGHVIYHIPINVSGYWEGTYTTPFIISRKSTTDSSFFVVLTAPLKYVTSNRVRHFINWSLRPEWTYKAKWYENNTIQVFVPNDAEYVATVYYTRFYFWYRLKVESNIPVLISYEGNVGSGSEYTNFTLYRESPVDDGLTVVLSAPSQVFYNGTVWVFDKWMYKIPEHREWREKYENPGEFSCPSRVANKGLVVAVYKQSAKLIVESYPVKNVPISIWYGDSCFQNYTDFVLEGLKDGIIISLKAPDLFVVDGEKYSFSHWLVNGEEIENELVEVVVEKITRAVVFYSKEDGGNGGSARLEGEWLIPGESVNITLPYSGIYTIKVTPHFNIERKLKALVVARDMSEYSYINLDNLTLLVRKPFIPQRSSMHISVKDLRKYPEVISGRFKGWYFLGASAWTPSIENSCAKQCDEVFDKEKWTTYAVYNLTITWYNNTRTRRGHSERGKGRPITWSKTIVVSSLNFTLWCFYDRYGVYVVWEAYYRYLPPRELNLSPEPPHQDTWFTLEEGDSIVFAQKLGKGYKFYGVRNGSVFCDIYIPYKQLIQRYGLRQTMLKARVRWSGPLGSPVNVVPFSEEKDIYIVPVGMKLLEIREKPLHLVFKWTLLNETALPRYSWLCPCVKVDVLTEWDGRIYEDAGVKSKHDYTLYIVDLDVDITWPRRITVFFVHSRTKNLLLVVPSVRL